jgi:hypothetical protein
MLDVEILHSKNNFWSSSSILVGVTGNDICVKSNIVDDIYDLIMCLQVENTFIL